MNRDLSRYIFLQRLWLNLLARSCLILFVSLIVSSSVSADPFVAPKALEPRVQFWVEIFSKYSQADFVVHHRMYPQAVFMELSLESYSRQMTAWAFDAFKRKHEKLALAQVKEAVRKLSTGKQPITPLEKKIVSEMVFIPGGRERYQAMLTEDLIRTQSGIREKTELALQRGAMYLPIIQQVFTKEYGLPTELTLLPMIESSFDYEAYSAVGAAGIWQLMPRTARQYGLRVTSVIDERRDVVESTRAAAKYFTDAYRALDSWPLAITSYNHGVSGVKRKVKQLGTRDIVRIIEHPYVRPLGFASNNFYPEFLAAVHIFKNKKLYFPGLQLPDMVHMTQVTLPRAYSLKQLATNLGLEAEVLRSYNYGLLNPILRGTQMVPSGYKLKVPHAQSDRIQLLKDLEPTRSTLAKLNTNIATRATANSSSTANASSTAAASQLYQVKSGDTLWSISKKYGVSIDRIRSLNSIKANTVKIGQRLKIS